MSVSSWLSWPLLRSNARRGQRRNPATTSPQPRHTFRPRLEALEIRLTPSITAQNNLTFYAKAGSGTRSIIRFRLNPSRGDRSWMSSNFWH